MTITTERVMGYRHLFTPVLALASAWGLAMPAALPKTARLTFPDIYLKGNPNHSRSSRLLREHNQALAYLELEKPASHYYCILSPGNGHQTAQFLQLWSVPSEAVLYLWDEWMTT